MKLDTRRPEQDEIRFTPISHEVGAQDSLVRPFRLNHGSTSHSRAVVPFYFERDLPAPTTLDADRRQQHAQTLIDREIDIRFASAREMASISLELYVRALISWDEYARLAFQPELHPDYDATIGALLGEQADPDKPRDFVRIWEERLAYERKYNEPNAKRLRATERITLMMRRLAGIPSLRA